MSVKLHIMSVNAVHIMSVKVFLNGKYSNTTYIYKIWPESKKPRFSIKNPEPQIKQKKNRSSEKNQRGNTAATVTWSELVKIRWHVIVTQ